MKNIVTIVVFIIFSLNVIAQNTSKTVSFSLKEAIDFAVSNAYSIKNADIDRRITVAKKGELRAGILPQINGNADYLHNIQVQNNILENNPNSLLYFPNLANGAVLHAAFTLRNQFIPSVTGSQVIFDQSLFTGLRAAKVSQELSLKNIMQTKIQVAYNVSRAYYAALVNEKQLEYIIVNLSRIDSSYQETKDRYETGLARQIEVDRIEVSYNNLQEERINIARQLELSVTELKYQMNLPDSMMLQLTDSLSGELLHDVMELSSSQNIDYTNRIEYSIGQTQLWFNKLDVKRINATRYPRLLGIGNFGYNPGATHLSDITQSDRWVYYSYIGLRLQVPIFNGFAVDYRVQQKKLEVERTENNQAQLMRTIDLQIDQSVINLNNNLRSMKTQKRNMELANKNLKVSMAEYKEGIATSLEVIVAEAALKEAQTNYYNALYNSLLSKVDYDRAMGTLLK